jgi:hypothetical protein
LIENAGANLPLTPLRWAVLWETLRLTTYDRKNPLHRLGSRKLVRPAQGAAHRRDARSDRISRDHSRAEKALARRTAGASRITNFRSRERFFDPPMLPVGQKVYFVYRLT